MSKFLSGAAFRSGSRKQHRKLTEAQKQPEVTQAIGFRDDDSPKTFSLVNKRMGKKVFFRFSKEKSLFFLSYTNPIRRFCIRLICTQWFDHFIIAVILINCVLLAADTDEPFIEYAFAVIYTIEMILKVLARGFVFHKHAYLRDPWNRLDFVVVLFGYLTLIDQLKDLSFIKALRVLRSLRTITVVPGLRIMVNSLLKSLKNLSDVMLLTLFFLAVFAIIGLQLFMGQLKYRCIRKPDLESEEPGHQHHLWWGKNTTETFELTDDVKGMRREFLNNQDNWIPDADDPIICALPRSPGTRQCPEPSKCLQTDINPNDGYTSFDNFGFAMLTCAQLITLDFWEDVYGKVLGSSGAYYIVYFLFIIFFGSFYLINLVLAVVAISYEQEVLSPQEEKSGLPNLDDDGDECSFVEEDEYDPVDGENHDQNHHGDGELTKRPEQRGFFGALRSCCCCFNEPLANSALGVDPENGTMAITMSPTKETCVDKFTDIWTWFRSHIKSFIYSFWFENGIMMCIVINTLCLALDSPSIGDDLDGILSKVNDCLTWIFTTELVIKLVGLLPTEFWKTKWNIFDTIIVIVSLIELHLDTSTSFNVSGLRSLRVLRVFRLAKSWSTMKALIDIIAESISGLVYLSIILGVVIYTLSVIGMNLFQNEYSEYYNSETMPRWNYQDFYHSFILLFRILCGEWIELLYETLNATNGDQWPVIFYLGALVLGNFLVLNLFLALLLNAFGEESIKEKSGAAAEANDGNVSLTQKIKNKIFNIRKKKHKLASEIRMSSLALSPADHMKSPCKHRGKPNGNPSDVDGTNNNNNNKADNDHDADEYMSSVDEHEGHDRYSCDDCCQCCMICCRPFCVCCSRFRAAVRRVVEHRAFEWTILFLIMASSLTLAFEDITLEKAPVRKKIVETLNLFYVVVFTIEMCLKLFAFGAITYFESAWHWIDSLVVAISIVSIVIKNVGYGGLKAIRALRALRPLRAISQWEGMRLSVNALISSIPSFGNVSLVCLVLWLVFCILGVQFFGNKFYKCVDSDGPIENKPAAGETGLEIENKTQCIAKYGEEAWQNSKINFDNTVMAFFALYQVATFEGWMEVMDDAVDSVDIDKQPIFEHSFIAYLFFLVFIFVGSFFTLNLLVGVIIDNFNRLKKEYEEKGQLGVLLTPAQRRWMSTFRKMAKTKPIRMVTRPTNKFMKFCYDMSENQKFEVVITIIILLNMVQMSMEHDSASPEFDEAMTYANYVFTVIYTLEAILKIIGTRKFYFFKSWNIFDFVIVVFAWLGIAMDAVMNDTVIDPSILRSFRVFRVARILRIIQMAKGIRRLLYTLICSLPALINIGTLLLLIIYIYAVVGVAMFGYVRRQGTLNDQVNFERTPSAIVLMTRLATSAGWNDVLDSVMVSPPDCDVNLYETAGNSSGDCGFKGFAIAYFSSFVLIAFLIMINMYIAVILDNFSEAQQADEIGIDEDDINLFYEKWKVFDPKASQFLNVSKLRDLVGQLSQPLGIPEVTEDDILQLDIPLYPSDRAHCIDVLQALISRTLGPNNNTDEFDMIKELMAESFRAAFPTLAAEVVETTTKQRLREIRAAIVLQKAFRRFKNYKRNEALEGIQQTKTGSPESTSLHPKV
ncbi:sodium channel protein type 9 subunit alpha-like isoform X8 [Bolinopsis microptera]|uniref:sodium channel protein type 9 subunit alpha-like isoform X8 n=1 Tax=Bolinopsis microptera TaxID=2820187 RepID=UPI003079A39B